MSHFPLLILSLVLGLGPLTAFAVVEEEDSQVEELTYEDLVNELNLKRSRVVRAQALHPLDDIQIHAGIGMIMGVHQISIDNERMIRPQTGFEISLGIDLLSPEWVSEGVLRNLGQQSSGSETRSLREFDLRVFHRKKFQQDLGYRIGSGLGTRLFKFNDPSRRTSISQEIPCWMMFGAFESPLTSQVSLVTEAALRSPLIDRTPDKSSLDLMVRLDTSF